MWHQPESASDRMSAHAHHPLVLGHASLVPRSCDPFVHHQGSLTSRRIRKNKSYLIGRKTYSSYANYFANYTNCEYVDLILTSHLGTHQFYTTVKEKVYLNMIFKKPRHNDILSKISFVLLLKVVQCHFLKHACY